VPPSSSLAGPYDDAPAAVATASMGDDVVASDAPDRAIIPSSVISSPSPPRAGALMKMLPPETWVVSTPISLMYFAIDVLAVVSSMSFLHGVVNSDAYHASPLVGKFAMALPLQILTGFAMWCTWCIGHDAGHGTVSKSRKYGNAINRIVGEVCHSAICLTPFVPWRLSHRKHHLNHNHIDRDYSHQWYVREESADLHPLIGVAHATRMMLFPFLYFFYLVAGVPDGGHVFFYGRMWDGHELKEKVDASLSVMTSFVTSGCLWHAMGTHDFALVCMMPWMVMSFWLFMVTYLQHHSSDGRLYTDDTFTFERGAFETVDRNYGKWVNRMSHHMMDGHVVHHLFFTKVPHYRLESATRALRTGMAELGMEGMYKRVDTPDYSQEIVRQFHDNWFFIDEDRVVR
jgi:omega-3 fatty acid desaturase (delta-15 desaturase)